MGYGYGLSVRTPSLEMPQDSRKVVEKVLVTSIPEGSVMQDGVCWESGQAGVYHV